jgi:hypothetical protein
MRSKTVRELRTTDNALALLSQQYKDAAFRDDFAKADEFDAAQTARRMAARALDEGNRRGIGAVRDGTPQATGNIGADHTEQLTASCGCVRFPL